MSGFRTAASHREIQPVELKDMLANGSALLIDVREPDEFAAGHIAGAVNIPLSAFSPRNVPDAAGRTVVLQCAGGKRSGIALDRCAQAHAAIDTHLGGGIGAWKHAGLPVVAGE
ncbi:MULTISPECIES: rhodanese-like domain-containing protein [unclassified Sphingomonas]|uniref:rhodanese-like domain-containing protein n=1 Tax=unclassified Sphingomonas TaxID=196159 RepID=UPI0006FE3F51|nr:MULTISPECIES: rhodanese-like domain-containing protein [unclassified Sphingomonas]KQX19474.1 sulfurtransferase [Sphingomonas sp. Root1294]KQY65675.1 sulfurtransferase [Sphingomonas sp. Root50]KRB95021.1 sulfurtransferase [Sphingomonas sp. Root720]